MYGLSIAARVTAYVIVAPLRQAQHRRLTQLIQTATEAFYSLHVHPDAPLHGLQCRIVLQKVPHHPLKHGILGLIIFPMLQTIQPRGQVRL